MTLLKQTIEAYLEDNHPGWYLVPVLDAWYLRRTDQPGDYLIIHDKLARGDDLQRFLYYPLTCLVAMYSMDTILHQIAEVIRENE